MLAKIFLRLVRCLRCGKLKESTKFPVNSKIWAMYCNDCRKVKSGDIP